MLLNLLLNHTIFILWKNSFINFKSYYIDETIINKNNEKIKCLMIQVPIKKDTKELLIKLENLYNNCSILCPSNLFGIA